MSEDPYVWVRCQFPEAAYLLWLCLWLPRPLARLWAVAVGWLMWWELDEGHGWQHFIPDVLDDDDGDDDDDDDGGDWFPAWTPQLGGAW